MGTIVAVRKGADVCLAADALCLLEEVIHPSLSVSEGCIVRYGDSLIGIHCSYAYLQVAHAALHSMQSRAAPAALDSRIEVRRFFQSLHDQLKVQFQVVPLQPIGMFEALPFNALIANRAGIFKVDASRAVYEFRDYWAVGSGEAFALGALHALYQHGRSSEEIARGSLRACGEFEANRGRELHAVSLRAPTLSLLASDDLDGGDDSRRAPLSLVRPKRPSRKKKPSKS